MKQFLNLMLVLAAVACAPAMAGSTQHINRTIDTEKAPDISIENAAGEILIRGTNASKITIAAELSENAKSLEVEERKGEVSIYVVYEKKNSWHKGSRLSWKSRAAVEFRCKALALILKLSMWSASLR